MPRPRRDVHKTSRDRLETETFETETTTLVKQFVLAVVIVAVMDGQGLVVTN